MGRRQTMQEKFKQQMKAYRKKRMKVDNTPFMPTSGIVYVMNTLNPTEKIKVDILKKSVKQHREIITHIACPVCRNSMDWDGNWEAFICQKHGKKAIYEIVNRD